MVWGDNLPDGFNRSQAVAAGIEERHPGFDSYFESLLDEMSEEEYAAVKDDLDSFYEQTLEEWRYENDLARGEAALERQQYENEWEGPW